MGHYKPLHSHDVSTGGGGTDSLGNKRGPRLFEMDMLSDAYWAAKEVGKWAGKQVVSNLFGPTEPMRKRGEPPFKSLTRETSTRSTSTPGQKRQWGQEAALNKQAAQRGLSARRNAADISMNNPRLWKDEAGHLWNPKTGKQLPHPTSHSHDVSVSNPPDWS